MMPSVVVGDDKEWVVRVARGMKCCDGPGNDSCQARDIPPQISVSGKTEMKMRRLKLLKQKIRNM
jgi:hypothetical protein